MAKLKKRLCVYLSEKYNTVHYHGDSDQVLMLQDFLEHGKFFPCDGPDSYIKLNEKVLIIEHFQFTCYKKSKRKGDIQEIESDRIDRLGDGLSYDEKMKLTSGGKCYLDNATSSFDKHYQKTQKYITKCISLSNGISESDIKVCFLIDDVSIVGSSYLDRSSGVLYRANIANCMEFLNHFRKHPRVDWILSGSRNDTEDHQVWFVSQKYIDEYIRYATYYSDKHFPYDEIHVIQRVNPINSRENTLNKQNKTASCPD